MKIAILSDDYLPSSTRVHAKMLHELANEFVIRGHQVVIITPGDWTQENKVVVDYIDEVEIWRFKSKATRGVGNIKRAIRETLLSLRAYMALKSQLKKSPFDICINYSPTIFFAPLAWFLKRKGTYVYLVLRDFFPQWIIDQGLIKEDSLIARYFKFFEHLNYSVSDCVAVQSPANLALFKKMYPVHQNTCVLMNWTSSKPIKSNDIFEKSSIGLQDKVILFYGGNIGHAQDMDNLMRLARRLKYCVHAHLLLIGQGDEFSLVENRIKSWDLTNVTLLPSVPQDEYVKFVAGVDIGLFSLSSAHSAHNFPGKLLGYMVESLPILGSVNNGNDVVEVINKAGAGFVSINGDDDILLRNALELINNEALRDKFGNNAFALVNEMFSVESAADDILHQASSM